MPKFAAIFLAASMRPKSLFKGSERFYMDRLHGLHPLQTASPATVARSRHAPMATKLRLHGMANKLSSPARQVRLFRLFRVSSFVHLLFLQQRPWDLFNYLLRSVNQGQRFRGFTRRQRQPSVAREGAPKLRGAGSHGESPHHTFELALEEALRSGQKHNHSLNSTFAHENVCHSLCFFKYI